MGPVQNLPVLLGATQQGNMRGLFLWPLQHLFLLWAAMLLQNAIHKQMFQTIIEILDELSAPGPLPNTHFREPLP